MNQIQFFDLEYIGCQKHFEDIYTFKFKPLSPLHYQAGQWIHIGFLGGERNKERVRHMSFSSAPGDEYLEFTMGTNSGTLFKKLMLDLKPTNKITAFKLRGNFVIDPNNIPNEVVFLAGGIGITPMRSLIRNFEQKQLTVNWSMLHVARSQFLFEGELKKLSNNQWRVNRQGIDAVWENIINKPSNTRYFICGSERFIEGMQEKLLASAVHQDQIVVESFH